MSEELRVRVELRGPGERVLAPVDADGRDKLGAFEEGEEFKAVLTQPRSRSLSQLRLYWVVCGMIADNFEPDTGHTLTKDHVDRIFRIEAGHSNVYQLMDGTYNFFPRSINFNAMAQEDFNTFMDRVMDICSLKFGPLLAKAASEELDRIIMGQTSCKPKAKKDQADA